MRACAGTFSAIKASQLFSASARMTRTDRYHIPGRFPYVRVTFVDRRDRHRRSTESWVNRPENDRFGGAGYGRIVAGKSA